MPLSSSLSPPARFAASLVGISCALVACLLWGQGTPLPANPPAQSSAPPSERVFSILIDPAHGGSESGALLNQTTAEKDVTFAFARRLWLELNARGVSSELMREGDQTISSDARAARANRERPALYLSIHASSEGIGLGIYSAMLAAGAARRGPFLDWETAQLASLARSRSVQQRLVASIAKTGFPVHSLRASLRPLSNVAVPALAIEISPTTGETSQLASADYQRMVASALANGLASVSLYLRLKPE